MSAWMAAAGCSGDEGGDRGSLQSSCVRDVNDLPRHLADGMDCYNLGYSDCEGLASECTNYCAFDVCQTEHCASDPDCGWLGPAYECSDYYVSPNGSFGNWCHLSDCPKGTIGCPCQDGGTCGPDPFGSGAMTCDESGVCQSVCPFTCQIGAVCCGGNLCSGDCAYSSCC